MTFDIAELERQVREDERRVRERVRRYEAYQAEINMAIRLAALQYEIAMRNCWVLALRPAFNTRDCQPTDTAQG